MKAVTDRGAGIVLAAASGTAVIVAQSFRAGFIADPIGPRAFPFGIFGLLALLGVVLALRGTHESAVDSLLLRRAAVLVGSLAAYVVLLSPLGFVVTTTVESALLGVLFGGRPIRCLAASAAMAVSLFLLFVYGFAVPLPIGALFTSFAAGAG